MPLYLGVYGDVLSRWRCRAVDLYRIDDDQLIAWILHADYRAEVYRW